MRVNTKYRHSRGRVPVGDSSPYCRVCVMFFECLLTPLSADSSLNYRIYRGKIVLSLHNLSHTHSCDQKATGVSLCIAQVPVFVLRKCVYCACPTGLAHSVSLQLEFKTNNDLKIIIE